MKLKLLGAFVAAFAFLTHTSSPAAEVKGHLEQWHRVELVFDGPEHDESDSNPNPFLDYRLTCSFVGPSGRTYEVPGFFDADGRGGSRGDVWKCRFAPNATGVWTYSVSFRQGAEIAVSPSEELGTALAFDGEIGTFTIGSSGKKGRDFRSPDRGRLLNVGSHYFVFSGSGVPWIKGGVNIPENFLGYDGFDNTPEASHSFSAHAGDWNAGDPDWGDGRGRNIIGALNYLSGQGANSIYFIAMNIGGDGNDTFPTILPQDKTHYDTSKLAQWEAVLTHADSLGLFLHILLSETEPANENYHDDGHLGIQRKLYYRELVARFSHHLGLEWDLGEENDYGTERRKEFARYLKSLDPYDNSVTTHIWGDFIEEYYGPLVGNEDFDVTAFQVSTNPLDAGRIWEFRSRSAAVGVPWIISVDEPTSIENDPTDDQRGYPHGRRDFMWPVYLSGGGGFEWYVQEDGGGHGLDQRIDDFRQMQVALNWTAHVLSFMNALPFWYMESRDDLGGSSAGGLTRVFARTGDAYALYNPYGGSFWLDLSADAGFFELTFFNPRTGEWFPMGTVEGGQLVELGAAPFSGDAAVLVGRFGVDGPIATMTATRFEGATPLHVSFDGTSSVVGRGPASYLWDFGDGSQAAGPRVDHLFGAPGAYEVVLTVVDAKGRADAVSRGVVVRPGAGSRQNSAQPTGSVSEESESLGEVADVPDSPGSIAVLTASALLTLQPVADAYVQGEAGFDDEFLKVEPGYRTSLMKFEIPAVSGSIERLRLLLQQSVDSSDGIDIEVSLAEHNDWTEESLDADEVLRDGRSLGRFSGAVPEGTLLGIDLDPAFLGAGGVNTFVLSSAKGNDVWFASSESGTPPQLEVTIQQAEGNADLEPIADAYVQGSDGIEDSFLKIEANRRTSYLKFDIPALSNPTKQARLILHQSEDSSNGIDIEVAVTRQSDWSEGNLDALNAPKAEQVIGRFSGEIPAGAVISIELDPAALANPGSYTIILSSTGGNDVWFASSESAKSPHLELSTEEPSSEPPEVSQPEPADPLTETESSPRGPSAEVAEAILASVQGPIVNLFPGQDLQSAVDSQPEGTAFVLNPGLYRRQSVRPKRGNLFVGRPGAVLSGARELTNFERDGPLWVVKGQTEQGQVHGACQSEYPGCRYPEDLYFDNQPLTQVLSRADLAPGTWYFDYGADTIYFADDPSGHKVELAVTRQAFASSEADVTIASMVIEKYANPAQHGAIHPGVSEWSIRNFGGGANWRILNNEVRLTHGAGIGFADGAVIRRNYVHHNGQIGIAGVGTNVLIEDNEISFNNTLHFDAGWEGGGTKFKYTTNLTVRDNLVHDNAGSGLWTDIDNLNTLYEGNVIQNNERQGIFHEISYAAVIRNNLVEGNGILVNAWLYGTGIMIAHSPNVEVYDNVVRGNHNGITGIQQGRGAGAHGAYELRNLAVHDNIVEGNAGVTGVGQDVGDNSVYQRNITFERNTYSCGQRSCFYWMNTTRSQEEWRAFGLD